jgi:hypothetical protein
MKHSITILTLIFSQTILFGQITFDTTNKKQYRSTSSYYSKTDFSFTDTLELWNYKLDTAYKGDKSSSIKPIGQLIFWRTKPIDDGISLKLYNQPWTPRITFEIFEITNLTYCYKESDKTRIISSCVPPEVGGDIIVIGKLVLLNRSVCLGCQRHDTKIDYCRPVVNNIFKQLDRTKVTTLSNLVRQFPIKEGQ